MVKIAIFCSGSGSNAEKIIEHFAGNQQVEVAILMANKKDAFALERAKKHGISSLVFNKEEFTNGKLLIKLEQLGIAWIVLAGFLWLMPEHIIKKYTDRIINIHPALLPKYGGKGMYGHHVHEAVIKNKESESGITIHFVNQHYDEGKIIFQAACTLSDTDDALDVAKKVQQLEHQYFPITIEKVILDSINN